MPISVQCPQCGSRLSVPESRAGTYVRCPHCPDSTFRVSAPAEGAVVSASPDAAGADDPAAAFLQGGGKTARMIWTGPIPEGGAQPAALPAARNPALPAPSSLGNGKAPRAARFLSVEAALSSLKLADEGKLPELRLHESAAAASGKPASRSNPLVLIGLLCLSAVATFALLFMPEEGPESARHRRAQQVRAALESDFFAERDGLPRFPYQFQLREARMAHLRGDARLERQLHRDVLALLRAERKPERGVTGSPGRDQELERHLIELLGD